MLKAPAKFIIDSRVRWGVRSDMATVADIDAVTHRDPWREGGFAEILRDRNTILMVAERGSRVLGYVVYSLHRDRVRVERLGVDPEFADKGVGTRVVDKLKSKLSEHRRTKIEVRMRETNLDGLLFLKKKGFMAVSLSRAWFEDSGEDMIGMEYAI